MPSSRFRRRMVRSTSFRPFGSSMAVGSSRMMHSGFIARMPATATRCFCPPDRWFGESFRCSYMPTAFKDSSTRRFISPVSTPRFSGPNATSSSTIVAMIWLSGFWNTIPADFRISQICSSSRVSIPHTITVPSVGARSAFSCLAKVDLPEPLWPRTAINCPFSTSMLTPSMARFTPTRSPFSSCRTYS